MGIHGHRRVGRIEPKTAPAYSKPSSAPSNANYVAYAHGELAAAVTPSVWKKSQTLLVPRLPGLKNYSYICSYLTAQMEPRQP